MARLIPTINPSEIENLGERKLAEALVAQLPADVEVFHSFAWLTQDRRGTVFEGEADFVVLDPSNGLLVIEVKGGSLEFDPSSMQWLRRNSNGTTHIFKRSPFEQARAGMYEVVERIAKRPPFAARGAVTFTHGYAVAFPDSRFTGTTPADIVPDLLLDAPRCIDLKKSIQKAFDRWHRAAHAPLNGTDKEAVYDALFPRYGVLPVLWRRVEDQEERLRRLTAEQQRLLDFLGGRRKAAIRGVAGSGKTVLAVAKAQSLAREGIRTLFLCYNKPLKEWLEQAVGGSYEGELKFDTYHGLAADLCHKAHVPFVQSQKELQDQEFWANRAPERLMDATDVLGHEHKFDALVVDEGQDFHDLWWTSLDGVFCDPVQKGCYYVFYDPKQNIYVQEPSIPAELGEPFVLPINCRNTVKIARHCASLVHEAVQVRDGAPTGDDPEMIRVASLKAAFEEAGRKVRYLCGTTAGGLRPSQVAVLAPGSTGTSGQPTSRW